MTNPYPWNQRGRKPAPQVEPTIREIREQLELMFGREKPPGPEPEGKTARLPEARPREKKG